MADAVANPALFRWQGAVPVAAVRHWLSNAGFDAPDDLIDLWARTGGGRMVETEDLLIPSSGAGTDTLDSAVALSVRLRAKGLPSDALCFHCGTWVSALLGGELILLEASTLREVRAFTSTDAWYAGSLREEFGPRYGLV